jgi:hypothetical protein
MGLLAQILRPSGPTHGGPMFLLFESSKRDTHVIKPHQQPPSASQVNFGLENSNLSPFGKVAEYSVLSEITC